MAASVTFAPAKAARLVRALLASGWCAALFFQSNAAGILQLPLQLKGLAYDRLTASLYGSGTNDLLRIDSTSGAVIKNYPLGTNVTFLSLGAGPGIWAVIEGERSVRRFDLHTLQAEEPVAVFTPPISDIYASKADPQFVGISSITVNGTWAKASVVRNGALLPDSRTLIGLEWAGLQGNSVYLVRGNEIYRGAVGPNGISQDVVRLFSRAGGKIDFVDSTLLQAGGDVIDVQTMSTLASLPVGGSGRGLAIDEDDRSIYLASNSANGNLLLSKYSYPALELGGVAEVPGVVFEASSTLAAWGTNHVALNTSSNLVLLDTSLLFQPARLSVRQTVPGIASFGDVVSFEVTIENPGPATAFNVTAANTLSYGAVPPGTTVPAMQPVVLNWPYILPGSSISYPVEIRAVTTATLTNEVAVNAGNAIPVPNSIGATRVVPFSSPAAALPFAARSLAFDSQQKRLFFIDPYNIWALDLDRPRLYGPTNIFENNYPVSALEAAPGGAVLAYRTWAANGELEWIDPETLATTRYFGVSGGFTDMAISPIDTNIVFVSDARGGVLYKDRQALGTVLPYSGRVEFASSGTNLYVLNPQICALETLAVTEGGLVPVSTLPLDTCSDFHQFDGLLYFDSGLVLDPRTGEKTAGSLSLPAGAMVVPRRSGGLDVVQRENGRWVIRRLNAGRQEIRRVPLSISVPPLQVVAAGENRVAFRTSEPILYLIDLDPAILSGRITGQDAGELSFAFDTVPAARYRFESSTNLDQWTALPDFVATASTTSQTISLSDGGALFFRIVQVP